MKRSNAFAMVNLFLCGVFLLLTACSTPHPQDITNACAIFQQNPHWYRDALRTQRRYGVPVSTLMAIMYQESRFQPTVKPPRRKLFTVIPWTRPTSADGYSQATYETWWDYQDANHNFAARRSNFRDAVDFVGWYCRKAHNKLKIPLNNTYELYLAYHEGLLGYAERTYRRKAWLIAVSHRVQSRANIYRYQLRRCGYRYY